MFIGPISPVFVQNQAPNPGRRIIRSASIPCRPCCPRAVSNQDHQSPTAWRDGGIDAIAWPLETQSRNEVLIVQSKYFDQQPTEKDLARFQEAKAALNGSLEDFQTWLDSCRDELHELYRRLRDERRRHRYVIIAPCRFDAGTKRALQRADIEVYDVDMLANLERNYTQGRTPLIDEIRLAYATPPRVIAEAHGIKVWVFTVSARALKHSKKSVRAKGGYTALTGPRFRGWGAVPWRRSGRRKRFLTKPCAACPSAIRPSWRSWRWPRAWPGFLICRPACQSANTIRARRVVVSAYSSSFRLSFARAIWTTARALWFNLRPQALWSQPAQRHPPARTTPTA